MPGPDFIGLGAQKTGTSWIYACLYDHPQICIPQKEIHFFSREHNWSQGTQWYERAFSSCDARVKGEFSPSYLYDGGTAERIHRLYPSAKLIASLRNPVDRAISHHLNDIKAGIVAPDVPFTTALAARPEYVDRGRYARQLEPYLQRFDRTQILILVYEDIRRDPLQFLRTVYRFLGVDESFVPSHLHRTVNEGQVPRFVALEQALNRSAGSLRRMGFDRLVWLVKQSGLPRSIRALNRRSSAEGLAPSADQRQRCYHDLREDIVQLETLLGRSLPWHQA